MRFILVFEMFVVGFVFVGCQSRDDVGQPGTPITQTQILAIHEPGDYQIEIQSAGMQRNFLLHIPVDYQINDLYPLVVVLHGRGGTSEEMAKYTGFSIKADEEGVLVIYPQAVWENRTWMTVSGEGSLEDLTFIWDAITYAIDNLGADPDRVYVVGFSNGGGMAHRLGCALAEKLAGIAAVAGSYPVHENCEPTAPLPVIAFHGTADYFVPFDGDTILPSIPEWAEAWAERNGCQTKPIMSYYQDDVRREIWQGCDQGVSVVLYTVEGGGHQWLGSPTYEGVGGVVRRVNVTDIIWTFFEK